MHSKAGVLQGLQFGLLRKIHGIDRLWRGILYHYVDFGGHASRSTLPKRNLTLCHASQRPSPNQKSQKSRILLACGAEIHFWTNSAPLSRVTRSFAEAPKWRKVSRSMTPAEVNIMVQYYQWTREDQLDDSGVLTVAYDWEKGRDVYELNACKEW